MTFIYRLGQSQGNRASRYSPHERQALSEEFSRREETGEGYGHVRVERTSDATKGGEAINMARNMTDRDPFRHLSTFRVNPGHTTPTKPTRYERKLHVALKRMMGNGGETLYTSFECVTGMF